MALKDWKKKKNTNYVYEWDSIKKKDNLFVDYDSRYGNPYEVVYGKEGYPKWKRFKTKTQALKYAKAYMRKN